MVNPRVPIEASRSGACADETKAGDRFVKDDYILCRGRRPRRPDADSPEMGGVPTIYRRDVEGAVPYGIFLLPPRIMQERAYLAKGWRVSALF